jgi:putative heme-binding domain-containing protein
MQRSLLILTLFPLLAAPLPAADNVQHGLRVPPGFEVTEFADGKLANDIYCLTLDPQGRVVVSGRGYIRVLVDDDGDGRADRALEIAAGPKDGAMGLWWEGEWLYFTGDGGLRRYHVPKSADRASGPSELIRKLKTGGEHDAHAVRRGPDGWLYVLCGNMTRVRGSYAQLPTSPIKRPVAGCVLRFSPDLAYSEIVADGFRNAYGMDFNFGGELFTFDSDNERCVSLPWYEPIRFYHVIPGGHYGWQAPQHGQWWRLPPYFPDVVAPVATFGRGSPTGVACYRHVQFPERYRGGFFLLDWTFGRVYFAPLRRAGASYTCGREMFLEAVGENGFAPTALAVHPQTGDLYVSIGGRGTRGAVYRIRYTRGKRSLSPEEATRLRVDPRSLDWRPELAKSLLEQTRHKDALDRLNALLLVLRHHNHFEDSQIRRVVRACWDDPDRAVRKASADLVATLPVRQRRALARQSTSPLARLTVGFGSLPGYPAAALVAATRVLAGQTRDPAVRLVAVRLLQLALGGVMSPRLKGTVWEGYSPRRGPSWVNDDQQLPPAGDRRPARLPPALFARAVAALRAAFPAGDADLDRETSRTLALLEDDDPATLSRVAAMLTPVSDPVEDVHYLIVLARLRGPRPAGVTRRTAGALLALDEKVTRRHLARDTHWPPRVAETHRELARKDPRLNAALLAHTDFGRPGHVLFAKCPGFDRVKAAEVFLARAKKNADYEWDAALIEVVAALPDDQVFPALRGLWDQGGLQEAILAVLARRPQPADRDKFLEGLNFPQTATVRCCLDALEKLPPRKDGAAVLTLVLCLRRLPDGPAEKELAEHLAAYLRKVTGQAKLGADRQAWSDWFARAYPKRAARLGNEDGVDVAAWNKRLAAVDWAGGSAARGQKVFLKASCASCHSAAQAIGPDLQGAAGRFSRADLFTAILQPSKDVAPRYRTTQVTTADGKVYQGMIIYEAVGSVLLQTGPDKTVRITNKQIAERRVLPISLMPAGLLDKLSDGEIADLYAYLKSLGGAPVKKPKKQRGK